MGNANSNVTSGVKKQTDGGSLAIYSLIDLKGGGELIAMMKEAVKNRDFTGVDEKIKEKVLPFLYNGGEGKMVPISELVLTRNKDRPKHKLLPANKGIPDQGRKHGEDNLAFSPQEPAADPRFEENPQFREVCWDLDQRGHVGETALHMCYLLSSTAAAELGKRLVKLFPKLINDIYQSDEYYGENVLHMAIVNEDPASVKFLLNHGANFHERANGNFFTAEDQKSSRTDTLEHEWVDLCVKTNYEGYVYWGEYPLSFAACLHQEECYRLLLARGAQPNRLDTNGNTVLHIMVIQDKLDIFDMVYELGASLNIRNRQGLTPLTLAAKLARKDIFFHILKLQREIYWELGSITCAAYPLEEIDTINSTDGEINKLSVLNLVTYGERIPHLDMLDGLLVDLLNAKWNTFVKFRFYRQFATFFFYFLFSITCFVLRPGPINTGKQLSANYTARRGHNTAWNITTPMPINLNKTGVKPPDPCYLMDHVSTADQVRWAFEIVTVAGGFLYLVDAIREARFLGYHTFVENMLLCSTFDTWPDPSRQTLRLEFEVFAFVVPNEIFPNEDPDRDRKYTNVVSRYHAVNSSAVNILCKSDIFEEKKRKQKLSMTVPSRVLFLFSCVVLMIIIPLRFTCSHQAEDIAAVFVMLTTSPYFLFFCRGFKIVGPFVVMIYKMILTDLLCFVTIYMVFVFGFSQAYYVIFLSYKADKPSFFDDPIQSILAMFVMSLSEFGDIYEQFHHTDHENIAKVLFIMYMALVALLLINMLIAMMGKTYQDIAERRNEWMRQWARIVLVVERGVPPHMCLEQQRNYSQAMADGRRALVLRLQHDEEEKEELRAIGEMKSSNLEHRRRSTAVAMGGQTRTNPNIRNVAA